ncbi:peptide alpha-N-acetyltransferase [Pseudohyphozyma bogoriensis]|nr:peptide alpha-N-acetyltransferase [Pseudohyphozyma bogoriensis]
MAEVLSPAPGSPTLPAVQSLSLSSPSSPPPLASTSERPTITYRRYCNEDDIPIIMSLVDKELSEPYNHYTYRYFVGGWPELCFFAYASTPSSPTPIPIGTIVCKRDLHRDKLHRGYLAMLSTHPSYRGFGIATHLARLAITAMLYPRTTPDGELEPRVDEVVLETECDNAAALGFYKKLGFIKEKRLERFYLNGKDAFRLVLKVPEV